MTKYLFLLAFILPFIAIGQFKMSAADKKTFDSLVHAPLKLAPSHTNCFSKDSNYLKAGWVGDQMPTIDGDKEGVIKVIMHPTNITFDSKGRVDSVYYEKDSTIRGTITGTPTKMVAMPTKDSIVKGWIVYYKHFSNIDGMKASLLIQQQENAIAHYHATSAFRVINPDGAWSWQSDWSLYKIVVDGKPFDLNKYYQFIPENQVVE